MELKKYLCVDVPEIRVQGRVSSRKTSGIPLFWTGSAIEFNITGRELWLEYTCNGDSYIRIEIDKFDMYRFPLEVGTNKVCIMRGFSSEDVKNIRIFRETQASGTIITLDALYSDGEFEPLPERKYKVEVFGDSVTSGEGLAGAVCLNHWIPAVFSCRGNYGLLVADALDADWSIVSQSGWGIFTDWRNDRNNAIPRYYDYVCGMVKNDKAVELGSTDIFDIENDKTNITIINLGGNDNSAFGGGEPWVDENGVPHKMKRPDDLHLITEAVYNFCLHIRRRNKNTVILVCHNMLTDGLDPQIIEGVEKFKKDTGDERVHTVLIPRASDKMKGARNHPGAKAHALYAEAIIAKLKEIL